MGGLYLLCGKPGCGKSTIAKELAKNHNYIHFSADDFMLKLYGEIEDRAEFEEKLNTVKELIYEICDKALINNNVVLDFGFWTKQERDYVRSRFPNTEVTLIYFDLSDDEIWKRIEKRNKNLKDNEYFMDRATFDFLSSKFEKPRNETCLVFRKKNYEIEELNKLSKLKNGYEM